jgi:hypothetical protein
MTLMLLFESSVSAQLGFFGADRSQLVMTMKPVNWRLAEPGRRQKHATYLIVVQRCQERNCASSEKSELRDSFIRLTLLAKVGRPSTKRWPFDNIGKSTKSEFRC